MDKKSVKHVLMIAYHFPPVRVSSGIQRTLKFTQYLLNHQWLAQVLTVNPIAYIETNDGQIKEIPDEVFVKRAFALDTSRHLAIKGRYLHWMALPDRWVSWCIGGVVSGLLMIVKFRPKIIWSTYPIATAHLIGLILHRLTGIPWIADFRDSMTEDDYPVDPTQRKVYRWIERQTIRYCSRAIFTTPGAIRMYKDRYPEIDKKQWILIPNGYDEDNFIEAEEDAKKNTPLKERDKAKVTLLHSGVLYPSERDPTQFFLAMQELLKSDAINAGNLKIILRATGHDEYYKKLIQKQDLQDIIFIEPGVSYKQALVEMLSVDGLIIFQAANCNHQIPAKIYEYLRARRPVLALTDYEGDTAGVLKKSGVKSLIAALDDKNDIQKKMIEFIQHIKQNTFPIISDEYIFSHSREARTEILAKTMNDVCRDS